MIVNLSQDMDETTEINQDYRRNLNQPEEISHSIEYS